MIHGVRLERRGFWAREWLLLQLEQAGVPKSSEIWQQIKGQGDRARKEAMAAKPLPDRVRSAYDRKVFASEVVKALERDLVTRLEPLRFLKEISEELTELACKAPTT